jgi:diaminohydroxyphosphoribosylaminopyrimidine deaminase / 5-amino-6-(5-phosphoribosylamino)uracil reductase
VLDAAFPDAALWRRLLSGETGGETAPLYAPMLAARAAGAAHVSAHLAQTLDGRIATAEGASFWISGEEDVLHTHRLRALAQAVVVGAGTIAADDPQLTVRACEGESPVRVVLDHARRLHDRYRVFAGGPVTLLLTSAPGASRHGTAEIVPMAEGFAPRDILAALAARGLKRVYVEGGGRTISNFLAAGALDRLHVALAPLLLGHGVPAFTLPPVAKPDDGRRVEWTVHRLGRDLLLDIPLHAR